MTIVRSIRQVSTPTGTVFPIWGYNKFRVKGMITVVTIAANAYIGPTEQLTITTGLFCPVGVPIYFGPGGLSPVEELSGIESTGSKVFCIYEEISDDPENDYQ